MHSRWKILGFAMSACLTFTPTYADSHGRSTAVTQHAQAPKAPVKPTTTGKPATGAASASTSTASGSTSPTSGSTSTTSESTSSATSGRTSTPLNPIATKISSKPQLNAKITAILPKGTTLNQASTGFKNQGQFIAALHVSRNLGCNCFKQLQTDMTKKNMSLGQAIQDVKKTANSRVEAQKAETEANDDVKIATTKATPASTGKNNTKNTTQGGDQQ
jgi:hypothetical protein